MSFSAGAITGTLGLDVSGYTQGILQAESLARVFPGVVNDFLASPLLGLVGIAKSAASAVAGAVREMGGVFDNAGESAEKLGVPVEWLTAMTRVAKDAGGSAEGLAQAILLVNDNAANAASGEATAVKAFESIGISADFLKQNLGSTQTVFDATTAAISRLDNQAAKTRALRNLMGRGGTDMTGVINLGTDELQRQMEIYRALGGTVNDQQAKIGDSWGKIVSYAEAAMDGIKSAVAQPILEYLDAHIQEIIPQLIKFSGKVRQIVGSIVTDVIPAGLKIVGMISYLIQHIDSIMKVIGPAVLGLTIAFAVGQLTSLGTSLLGLVAKFGAAEAAALSFSAAQRAGLAAGIGGLAGNAAGGGGFGATAGGVVGGVIGGAIGQALIPIPGVGFFLGSAVGGVLGGKLGGQFDGPTPDAVLAPGRAASETPAVPPARNAPASFTPPAVNVSIDGEALQAAFGGIRGTIEPIVPQSAPDLLSPALTALQAAIGPLNTSLSPIASNLPSLTTALISTVDLQAKTNTLLTDLVAKLSSNSLTVPAFNGGGSNFSTPAVNGNGQPQINVGGVSVSYGSAEASSQVAGQILPPIQAAINAEKRKAEAAAMLSRVNASQGF